MLDERALRSVAPALDQLYSVFNEVGTSTSSLQAPLLPCLGPTRALLVFFSLDLCKLTLRVRICHSAVLLTGRRRHS